MARSGDLAYFISMGRGSFSPRNSNSIPAISWEYWLTTRFSSTMSSTISGEKAFSSTSKERKTRGMIWPLSSSSRRKGVASMARVYSSR